MEPPDAIVRTILKGYPNAQAIYLFGSYGTEQEWPSSDVDVAVLLTPKEARQAGSLAMSETRSLLEESLGRSADLINLRRVTTVLQKEVVMADRRIYTADRLAAEEFEMLTISDYQKLNEERTEIVAAAMAGGRFYGV